MMDLDHDGYLSIMEFFELASSISNVKIRTLAEVKRASWLYEKTAETWTGIVQYCHLQGLVRSITALRKGLLQPLARHSLLDNLVLATIVMNSLFAIVLAERTSMSHELIFDYIGSSQEVIKALFVLECGLKISAFGPEKYFSDRWSRLDFILVVMMLPSYVSEYRWKELGSMQISHIFKIMILARILRLIRFVPHWAQFVAVFFRILEGPGRVMCILGIVTYSWVSMTAAVFASTYIAGPLRPDFTTHTSSFLLYFQLLTGEQAADVQISAVYEPAGTFANVMHHVLFVSFNFFVCIIMVSRPLFTFSCASGAGGLFTALCIG